MSETETKQYSLPEHNEHASVSPNFLQQEKELQRIISEPRDGDFAYESFLPEVIGHVPEEEREKFDKLNYAPEHSDTNWSAGKGGVLSQTGLKIAFPGIFEVIHRDMERLGIDLESSKMLVAEFERNETEAMNTPRQPGLHVDHFGVNRDDGSVPIFYLIANRAATEYYEGSAHLTKQTNAVGQYKYVSLSCEEGTENQNGFGSNGLVAPGPNYGVVRLHGLTMHRSPLVHEDTLRTFSRIKLRPRSEAEAILS